ncbi:hypothetical protein [Haloparvum sedimenti]|uniref:hypothetical protein n=1 Tax=Haloparvum sedimenti TaxID=1678448 RepID=UPI00071E85BE|nr:hypothetical protein [Haloparvum sedimenti]
MTDTPDADADASPPTDADATPNDRPDADGEPAVTAAPDEVAGSEREDEGRTRRLRSLLDKAALGAFVFVALVTSIGFYRYTGATVRTWVDPAYQPIVLAAFNLALLFVAAAGVSVQLRRLGED